MHKLNKSHVGLALGSFVALAHFVWSVLIAIGIAQPLMDFILSLHHIALSYVIMPFDIVKAIGLIVITFVVGYIVGWVFAWLWNKYSK
jgi:hypothetical protein